MNTPEDDAFVLVDEFTGRAGELIAPTTDGTGYSIPSVGVRGDADGDGVADFSINVRVDSFGAALSGPWADNLRLFSCLPQ